MALTFVGKMNVPTYTALSTDISSSKIAGASIVGGTVFTTDDAAWYIIKANLELTAYVLPVEITVDPGSITIGAVSIDQPVADAVEIAPYYDTKSVAVRGTSEKLSETDVYVVSLIVFPFSTNVGNIYLGTSGVDYSTSKQIILTPTSTYVGFDAPLGYKLNLKNFYVDKDNNDGGNADGVYFFYLK
jgi:hypothetical protein